MRRWLWNFGWVVALIAIFVISLHQLSEDASPAATFCHKAERQGYECQISPNKFDAQVVLVDDGMGNVSYVLIISDGKKIIQAIPLQ